MLDATHPHTHLQTHMWPYSHTHSPAEMVQSRGGCFLSGSPAESMQTSLRKHNPLLGSTQLLLGSSQRANLRLALDLLPKRAGLKLAHPQALAPGHLKNTLWGKLPAVTAFILVNLAGGVQRVTPGLFTPAGMNGPSSECRDGYNFSYPSGICGSVGSESSLFFSV